MKRGIFGENASNDSTGLLFRLKLESQIINKMMQ